MEYFAQLKEIVSKKNHAETGDVLKAISKIEKKCKTPDPSILPAFKAKIDQIITKLDTSILIYKQLIELLDIVNQGSKKVETQLVDQVVDESKSSGDAGTSVASEEVESSQDESKMAEPTENINDSTSSTSSAEFTEEEAKQYELIEKLDIAIQKIAHEIRRLEALEVDFDNNQQTLKQERLCRKLKKLYARFVAKCSKYPNLIKLYEDQQIATLESTAVIKFKLKSSANSQLNEFVSRKLRNKFLPDYCELLNLIVQFNTSQNLTMTEDELSMEAKRFLTDVVTKLKNRRQKDLRENRKLLIERFTGKAEEEADLEDPALKDEEVKGKLQKSEIERKKQTEAIILEYALKQEEKKDNDSNSDKENDDEDTENEEGSDDEDDDEDESENDNLTQKGGNLEVLKAQEPAKAIEPIVLIPRRKRPGPVENPVQPKKEKPNEDEIEVITLD